MIEIHGPAARLCDGIRRRAFLQLGALGPLGLALPQALAAEAAQPPSRRKQTSCILIWLQGGPSQHETFDPKPDAPAEVRGPFRPIETNVSGIRIAEVFPKLARHAEKYALLRSVHHPTPAHIVGHQHMLCGMGNGAVAYPSMAAVIAKLRGGGSLLPPWVLVPNIAHETNATPERLCQTAGYLGPEYDAVVPQGDLVGGALTLENLDPPRPITGERMARRRQLLDTSLRRQPGEVEPARSADAVYRKALALLDSAGVRQTFELRHEADGLRDRYGRNHVGQGCLLARRLVEAGVRFVTVNWPNRLAWDVHTDLEGQMRTHLCPTLDRALSTLLDDLHQRGLLETTLVVVMGEMGRTPKIGNAEATYADGRDHWSSVMSVLMAGGGVQGGQVIGASDGNGAFPGERPVPSHDVVASVYHAFGIAPDDTVPDVGGRPHPVIDRGAPVLELLLMETFTDPKSGLEFVRIPAGEFRMGSDEEDDDARPVHLVRVSAFRLSRCEVTREHYARFMKETGHPAPAHWTHARFDKPEQPVMGVTYDDALAYCRWAGGRLPAEAEWEYAARGPDGRRYPWGSEEPDASRAVFHQDIGFGGTAPAGSAKAGASPFGVLDMAGNVFEWCADWYDPGYYARSPREDPPGPPSGELRVVRGGAWISLPDACRAAARAKYRPSSRSVLIGIRVARDGAG